MLFKTETIKSRLLDVNPLLIMIYADLYCRMFLKFGVKLVLTEAWTTKDEDAAVSRKSTSHFDKRALDIRSNNLTPVMIEFILDYLNNHPEFMKYAYLTRSGILRLAYYHDNGNGKHIHLSIHSRFSLH